MRRWDNFWLGLVLGLLLPLLFCLAYAHTISLQHFWQEGMYESLRPVITFANMAVMFLLYELNLWRLAKGLLVAILPYMAAAIVIL